MEKNVVAGRQAQLEEKKERKQKAAEEKKYFDSLLAQEKQARLEKGIANF